MGKRKPDSVVKFSVDMDDDYRVINGKDENDDFAIVTVLDSYFLNRLH